MTKQALIDDYIREFVGKHGSMFLPPNSLELPPDLQFGEVGKCFENCLLAALESDGKYLYCEGLGIYRDEAYVHAWLTDKDRSVAYDLTWFGVTRKGKVVAAPAMYKGVVIDTDSARRFCLSTRSSGILSSHSERPKLFKQVLKASQLA